MTTPKKTAREIFTQLGIDKHPAIDFSGGASDGSTTIASINPTTGQPLATIHLASKMNYEAAVVNAQDRFNSDWRDSPAPKRGEIVRQIGEAFRKHKEPLGELISLEMGKIRAEGLGEIQECIDICDFAVGLSRQLYGLSMHSERPSHRMYEQWHPLGVIGIITAFNFPAAVWAWNAMVAAVCGDTMVWKPSLQTPLVSIAMHEVVSRVLKAHDLDGVCELVIGTDSEVGEAMIRDRRLPLISATGSCRMGKHVGQIVAGRMGKTLLELGGNNAIIVTESADMDLAVRAVVFGAVGTAGQRCTTTRRLLVHRSIHDQMIERLKKAYEGIVTRIGDPLDEHTLMGPVISEQAIVNMMAALEQAKKEGGEIVFGGNRVKSEAGAGFFVEPTIVKVKTASNSPIVQQETFAPILYVIPFDSLDEAIAIHNSVHQGLSSAIFTDSVRQAERFLSAAGSDCGISNVNIGTSGAEIGGAFGGEKETGGGRESGSDAWKNYMRRQTCTINWGSDLPLAQGIEFE